MAFEFISAVSRSITSTANLVADTLDAAAIVTKNVAPIHLAKAATAIESSLDAIIAGVHDPAANQLANQLAAKYLNPSTPSNNNSQTNP